MDSDTLSSLEYLWQSAQFTLLKHIANISYLKRISIRFFGITLPPKLITSGTRLRYISNIVVFGNLFRGIHNRNTSIRSKTRGKLQDKETLLSAYQWIKKWTPLPKKWKTDRTETPVMAAHWTYGSQLNILAQIRNYHRPRSFLYRTRFISTSDICSVHNRR